MALSTAFSGSNVRLSTRNVGFRAFTAPPKPVVSSGLLHPAGGSSSRDNGLSSVSISPLNVPSISGRTGSRTNVIANAAKVTGKIKLALTAGKANPAPPVGPALGSKGVNIMAFCKEYNAQTAKMAGQVIPVEITVYEDRSFTFVLKTSPASILLKKAAGIEAGSGKPNKDVVGKVTRAQVAEIAKIKLPDTNATKVESVIPMIEGTAKNMGIKIVD